MPYGQMVNYAAAHFFIEGYPLVRTVLARGVEKQVNKKRDAPKISFLSSLFVMKAV
jgi:hypothetical protein